MLNKLDKLSKLVEYIIKSNDEDITELFDEILNDANTFNKIKDVLTNASKEQHITDLMRYRQENNKKGIT